MPYLDVVRNHGRNNHFEYDHKAIYKQVRQAMKKSGDEREQALKAVLDAAYRKEAVRYEAMRQQRIADFEAAGSAAEANRLDGEIRSMAKPARFLEQMAEIVGEMAKDTDGNYQPKELLGLTAREAKNLVSFQLSSYSRLDKTMYSLQQSGWENARDSLNNMVTNIMSGDTGEFATADNEQKAGAYEAYIRKEELKKQLNSKGFFWRLFHRSDVKAMQEYIDAAETALNTVGFPEMAIGEAKAEYARTAARDNEYEAAHQYLDEKLYVAPDEMEQMLGDKTEEELIDILEQKAAEEDRMIERIQAREEQKRLQAQRREAQKQASIKKPTNRVEVKQAFSNTQLTKIVQDQFVALMDKATTGTSSKESKANDMHKALGAMIGEMWTEQTKMASHATKMFKAAYQMIRNDTPGMSVAEKLVAAQRISDIMLNTYSPVASNPSLAQYGNNYGVQKMDHEDIQELTGYEGDVNALMSSVKIDLGMEKEKVDFGNEFGEAENEKAAKVEEHKAPVVENVRQS